MGSFGDNETNEEEFLLLQIFRLTLARCPVQRNLGGVIQSLLTSLEIDEHCSAVQLAPLPALDKNSLLLPRPASFLAKLGRPLRACFLDASKDVASQCRKLLTLAYTDTLEFLYIISMDEILKCQICGIGCERNANDAFETLLEISQLKSPHTERASAILLSLRGALGAIVKEDLAEDVFLNTLHAAGNEVIPALTWIKEHTPDAFNHPSYVQLHTAHLWHMHNMNSRARSIQSEDDILALLSPSQNNFDVNEHLFGNGNTILHVASLFGNLEMLKLLVEKYQADVNVRNSEEETPLLIAFMHGRQEHIVYLLRKNADITTSTPNEYSSILNWLALVDTDHLEIILDLLSKRNFKLPERWCQNPLESLSRSNFTFHHSIYGDGMLRAIGTRRLDVVQGMVQLCKQDRNYPKRDLRNYFGGAIAVAAILHCREILEFLLSLVREGSTGTQKHRKILDKFLPRVAQKFATTQKHSSGWRLETGSSLLRYVLNLSYSLDRIATHGANFQRAAEKTLEVLNASGFVEPLVFCESELNSTIVSTLDAGDEIMALHILKTKACQESINVPDPQTGFTPLHAAIRVGSRVVFSRLLDLGAVVDLTKRRLPGNCLDISKASFLHACASHGADVFFAEKILDAGVPVDIPDHNNNSALHMALVRRHYDLARLFLRRGDDLNRIVNGEWTVMGTLVLGHYREHYRDFLGAMRFVLSLEDPTQKPDFVIYPSKSFALLHAAVETDQSPEDDHTRPMEPQVKPMTFDAFTSLVLDFYSMPEQINAKSSSGLTALHKAIMNRNLSAVQLLLGRGADVMIPPPESIASSTFRLSQDSILLFGNQSLMRGQIPKSWRERAKRSTAISNLIYNAGNWPNESGGYRSKLVKLYRAVEPYLGQMQLISHADAKQIDMQKTVHATVMDLGNAVDRNQEQDSDIKASLEFQEHINSLLQPWFMAEIGISVFPNQGDADILDRDFLMGQSRSIAIANVSWLSFFTSLGIQEIQEAALYDVLLRNLEQNPEQSKENDVLQDLAKYARSRKPEDLPMNPLVVRYPYPLKHTYEGFLKLDGFPSHGFSHVLSCLRFLDAGAHPEKFSIEDPPPMSAEEFKKFHLQKIQGKPLEAEKLGFGIHVGIKCACHNDKIRKIPLDFLDSLVGQPSCPHELESLVENCYSRLGIRCNFSMEETLNNVSLPTSKVEDDISSDTVHFGIFCAGRACAPNVWTQMFIRGTRYRCGACGNANFCEVCKPAHTHPNLYVHHMHPYYDSQFSLSVHEKLRNESRSIEQTVWEIGKLKTDGKIEFEGKLIKKGSLFPEARYLKYEKVERSQEKEVNEDTEKEKADLWKTMLRWIA